MTDPLSGSDEERAARRCIDAAGRAAGRRPARRAGRASSPLLFARAAPEDLVRYDAARTRGARARGLGVSRRAQAGRAEDPLRVARRRRGRAAQGDLGDRDRQRRHAVPGRFGDGRARPSAGSTSAWSCIRSSRSSAIAAGQLTALRAATRAGATAQSRESFIHIHVERIDDEARRAEIVAGARAGARRRARLRAGLAADARRASAR